MNKTQLIDFIAEKADLSKAQAKAALEATLGGVTEALKEGDQVQLIGFWYIQSKPSCSSYWSQS